MKKIHPGRFVTFVRPHVQVHPATVLEGHELRTGAKYTIAEIPEKRDVYTVGQELQFGSVNAARDFVRAVNEGAGETVCHVGKSPAVRYSDADVASLLRESSGRPAWERTAHLKAAARQRGYGGDESNAHAVETFLMGTITADAVQPHSFPVQS